MTLKPKANCRQIVNTWISVKNRKHQAFDRVKATFSYWSTDLARVRLMRLALRRAF
jgi:hypothetical protein